MNHKLLSVIASLGLTLGSVACAMDKVFITTAIIQGIIHTHGKNTARDTDKAVDEADKVMHRNSEDKSAMDTKTAGKVQGWAIQAEKSITEANKVMPAWLQQAKHLLAKIKTDVNLKNHIEQYKKEFNNLNNQCDIEKHLYVIVKNEHLYLDHIEIYNTIKTILK